jgi:hypothetical protein
LRGCRSERSMRAEPLAALTSRSCSLLAANGRSCRRHLVLDDPDEGHLTCQIQDIAPPASKEHAYVPDGAGEDAAKRLAEAEATSRLELRELGQPAQVRPACSSPAPHILCDGSPPPSLCPSLPLPSPSLRSALVQTL